MHWQSVADFLAMGQHGLYVWGSVLVTAGLMIGEPLLVVRGRKAVIGRLRRQLNADQADRRQSRGTGEPGNARGIH